MNSLLSSASSIRHSKYYNATLSTLGARCSSTAQHNRVDDNTISTQNNSKELPLSAFYAYALLLVWISTKGADAAQPSRSRTLMRTQQTHERLFSSAHCCKYPLFTIAADLLDYSSSASSASFSLCTTQHDQQSSLSSW